MKNTLARLALVAVVGILAWAQAWLLDLPREGFTTTVPGSSLSCQYTGALARGRSYLPLTPDPRLVAAANPYDTKSAPYIPVDLSYYRGHFYLYFGIVPFLTIMVPWYKATGTFLTDAAVIWFFSALGLCAYSAAVWLLWRRLYRTAGTAAALLSLLIASTTNCSWLLLARPSTYELACAAAFGCFGAAVLASLAATLSPARAGLWLATGVSCLGLAMGCRPNLAPGAAVLSLWLLGQALQAEPSARRRRLGAVLVPLVVIGAFLAWYNFQRFGNPFEFGFRYQGGAPDRVAGGLVSLSNLPYNLHRYLLGRPNLGHYFPFFLGEAPGPFARPALHVPTVLLYGCLITTPAIVVSALAFLRRGPALTGFGWALLAGALGNLLLLSMFGNGCYRYPVDFLGPLSFLAATGVFQLHQLTSRRWRGPLMWLTAGLTLASALLVFLQVISIAQIWGQFDTQRPADFARLARPFNAVVYRGEQLLRAGPTAVRLTVEFPSGRSGHSEPLIVRGSPGAIDILYVYYPAPGLITLGLSGGPSTGEMPADYRQTHVIEARYGNALPPAGHPMLAGVDSGDLALARRMITVLLDGNIVLDGWVDFCRTDGNVYLGESPYEPVFGTRFTGKLKKVEHPPLAFPASPLRWQHAAYGPIEIAVSPVPLPVGVREPLLSCGHRGQGIQVLVEHLPQDRARIGWLETRGRQIWGEPIAWRDGRTHVIRIDAGVLFPPETSSLWPAGLDPKGIALVKTRLQIWVDGQLTIQSEIAADTVSPATISIGHDDLYLTDGVTPGFEGRIESVERLAW